MPFVSPLNYSIMAQPTFHNTMSIATFKDSLGISTLNVIRNSKTDKLFMADAETGKVLGAVSPSYTEGTPVVSEVSGEDGTRFFLLHKKGESGNVENTF
jgi:hypothetical protein